MIASAAPGAIASSAAAIEKPGVTKKLNNMSSKYFCWTAVREFVDEALGRKSNSANALEV